MIVIWNGKKKLLIIRNIYEVSRGWNKGQVLALEHMYKSPYVDMCYFGHDFSGCHVKVLGI